jgi:hypothetical protein
MNLLSASFSGLELHAPQMGVLTLDFVMTGKGQTVVTLLDWWDRTWSLGDTVFLFENVPHRRGEKLWVMTSRQKAITFRGLSATTRALYYQKGRKQSLIQLARYSQRVRELQAAFPDQVDAEAWIELLESQPKVDPVKELRTQNLGARKIGILPLIGQDGSVVDALALDENGNMGVANGSDWLQSIGEQWVYADGERPDMGGFLKWASEQRPHGFSYPGEPRTINSEGDIKGVAINAAFGTV